MVRWSKKMFMCRSFPVNSLCVFKVSKFILAEMKYMNHFCWADGAGPNRSRWTSQTLTLSFLFIHKVLRHPRNSSETRELYSKLLYIHILQSHARYPPCRLKRSLSIKCNKMMAIFPDVLALLFLLLLVSIIELWSTF